MHIRRDGLGFIIFLGALSALPPLAIDMGLPALTAIQTSFQVPASLAGLTLSLFVAGFASTPLVYGLLSDRYGRRPVLLAGMMVFALAGLACALAPSISTLLLARLVQGAGAGAGATIAFAVVRDLFDGAAMRKRLSIITMVVNTAPMIAPSLGAGLLALGGWRSMYALLGIGGIVLVLAIGFGFEETRVQRAGAASITMLQEVRRGVSLLLAHPGSLAYTAIYSLSFASMFAYVAASPLVLIGVFKVPAALYALLFACTALGIVSGAFFSERLSHTLKPDQVIRLGLLLALAGPLGVGALMLTQQGGWLTMMPLLVLATFGYGLVAPAASHAALSPLPEAAGLVAALMTSLQMLGGALGSALVAFLFVRWHALAMVDVMLGFAAASLAVHTALPWLCPASAAR
jgi:DHA1 family bicyclomycin/chloramphenicol resistance-like MFS transporter